MSFKTFIPSWTAAQKSLTWMFFCLRAETPGVKLFLTSVIICSGLHPQFGLENGQHGRTRLVLNLDINTDCKMYFQEILKEICPLRWTHALCESGVVGVVAAVSSQQRTKKNEWGSFTPSSTSSHLGGINLLKVDQNKNRFHFRAEHLFHWHWAWLNPEVGCFEKLSRGLCVRGYRAECFWHFYFSIRQ